MDGILVIKLLGKIYMYIILIMTKEIYNSNHCEGIILFFLIIVTGGSIS